MIRNLYRVYLYAVYIALLDYIVFATSRFLEALFRFVLPHEGNVSTQFTQATIFAVVSWVLAGALIVLHVWLIRRDIQNHPEARGSAIRHFFLNLAQGANALTAFYTLLFAFQILTLTNGAGVQWSLAAGISTLALWGWLQWERQHSLPATNGARFWERLHLFGVQAVLLLTVGWPWDNGVRTLMEMGMQGSTRLCSYYGSYSYCETYQLFWVIVSMFWPLACWFFYAWLTRNETGKVARFLLHGLGFAWGIVLLLNGVNMLGNVLFSALYGHPLPLKEIFGREANHNFLVYLVLALIVMGVYVWLYARGMRQGLLERPVGRLILVAIVTIVSAGSFWVGCGLTLYNALQLADVKAWINCLSIILAGLAFVPLDLYLLWRVRRDPQNAQGPRRGVVLFLLGAGILAGVIGAASALYAFGSSVLGSALENGTQVMHAGLSAFLIGLILFCIYFLAGYREHLLVFHKEPAPSAPQLTTLEAILDAFRADQITREQALTALRTYMEIHHQQEPEVRPPSVSEEEARPSKPDEEQ
ncbi:hypothetical protein EI42_00046 [Thermosporothrix hazakensis]|jgi:predicted nucleic acid-binding Zn ribbon protein|uniref:DUF5671 domain-containing protein n=2 Tax=Thermosporothrix TaxID=768650 RepID=A0A326UBC3_THEHA|nr:DUF5671 domain-containing protein [Thermosporothrix hazakensis]PZW35882.1 hypothetical protein EI42_00046 [Thermosporothrix hazakensis]BBH88348.1 hypothetical protein KTC_30990 [Thermosporothrix sp. COM3]GCE46535.1 hypothetical protein KTH_14040 [Thermosporothrix hazakensis]